MTLEQYFAPLGLAVGRTTQDDLDMSDAPRPCCPTVRSSPGRQVAHCVPRERVGPGRHWGARRPPLAGSVQRRHRRRGGDRGNHGLPAVRDRPDCRPGICLASPRSTSLWRSTAGGGPPIVAGGLVWTIGSERRPLRAQSGLRGRAANRPPSGPRPTTSPPRLWVPDCFWPPRRTGGGLFSHVLGVLVPRGDDHFLRHDDRPRRRATTTTAPAPAPAGGTDARVVIVAVVVACLTGVGAVDTGLVVRRRRRRPTTND